MVIQRIFLMAINRLVKQGVIDVRFGRGDI